jgi:NAD(P)-dependent dehydrogenase (short-subunit alcohol dehydrogenase family)
LLVKKGVHECTMKDTWEVCDYRKTTGTAEEVAEAVLFLVAARTTYVLGEVIEVNGGQLMD